MPLQPPDTVETQAFSYTIGGVREPKSIRQSGSCNIHDQQNRFNSACAKALSGNPALSIDSGASNDACRLGLRIPAVDFAHPQARPIQRGIADAIAMIDLHHHAACHATVAPVRKSDRLIFDEMELTRCLMLGAYAFAGVANNLCVYWNHQATQATRTPNPALILRTAIACFTRESLGINWPIPAAVSAPISLYRSLLQAAPDSWQALRTSMHDQAAYAELCLAIIAALPRDFGATDASLDAADDDASVDETDTADKDDQCNDTETVDSDEDDPTATITINIDLREAPEPPDDAHSEDEDDELLDDVTAVNRDAPVQDGQNVQSSAASAPDYTVYSTEYDEVISAESLCSADELSELRDALDQQIERHARVVNSLAGKLQRLLMAQQQRHWIFDLEEGQLDTSQLTRVVTRPRTALSFKQESEIKFRDTVVTLLVDNSRSMLGKPIAIAAACADLLAQTLERCGVTVEILGFTTTELHGGSNAENWQQAGGKINPGRLNALRHIIYKPASAPYRRGRRGIGLMLRSELLKQNIDGEALLWANQRLTRRSEQRKILMVISDGAPLDTSTMAANKQNILIEHLHQVIADIEKRGATELVAIGIGHDVSQFYKRATNIYDSRYLGRAMLSQLTELFSGDNAHATDRQRYRHRQKAYGH